MADWDELELAVIAQGGRPRSRGRRRRKLVVRSRRCAGRRARVGCQRRKKRDILATWLWMFSIKHFVLLLPPPIWPYCTFSGIHPSVTLHPILELNTVHSFIAILAAFAFVTLSLGLSSGHPASIISAKFVCSQRPSLCL